jgi:hypothetical protein
MTVNQRSRSLPPKVHQTLPSLHFSPFSILLFSFSHSLCSRSFLDSPPQLSHYLSQLSVPSLSSILSSSWSPPSFLLALLLILPPLTPVLSPYCSSKNATLENFCFLGLLSFFLYYPFPLSTKKLRSSLNFESPLRI